MVVTLRKTGKRGRPRQVLPKGLIVRLKNKSSKRRDAGGKLDKIEIPLIRAS